MPCDADAINRAAPCRFYLVAEVEEYETIMNAKTPAFLGDIKEVVALNPLMLIRN